MFDEGNTVMNEAQPLSLRSYQAHWEGGEEPVPDGHGQCSGSEREEVELREHKSISGLTDWSSRHGYWHRGGKQVRIRNSKKSGSRCPQPTW